MEIPPRVPLMRGKIYDDYDSLKYRYSFSISFHWIYFYFCIGEPQTP